MDAKMFCYQCQETAKGIGCEIIGVCGKKPELSARMRAQAPQVRPNHSTAGAAKP